MSFYYRSDSYHFKALRSASDGLAIADYHSPRNAHP